METEFISKFEMSEDVNGSTRVVPLEYISSPLFVYIRTMVVVQESISVHYQRENGDVILEIRYKSEIELV